MWRPCNERRAYAARVSLAARRAIQNTMSEQEDPNEAAAEQYAAKHGGAFVRWLQDNTVECCCEEPYACAIVDLRIGHVKTKTGHVYGSDGVAYGGQVPRHGITTVGRLDGIRRCLTNKDISRWPRLH